jgi:hypothetical protein
MRQMLTGGIAMEDLQQKQLHSGDRIQQAVSPRGVAHLLTSGVDRVGLQLGSPIRFETLEDGGDTGHHSGLS